MEIVAIVMIFIINKVKVIEYFCALLYTFVHLMTTVAAEEGVIIKIFFNIFPGLSNTKWFEQKISDPVMNIICLAFFLIFPKMSKIIKLKHKEKEKNHTIVTIIQIKIF